MTSRTEGFAHVSHPSVPAEKKVYTVNEVADMTGLSRSTIYAQCRAGKLIAQYPPGIRTRRFSEKEVDRWIKSWSVNPPEKKD